MKDRVRRILELVSPKADALLIANSTDPHLDGSFFYAFDVPGGLFEGSVAVGLPDGKLHVLSSPLEEESAVQAAKRDPAVDIHVATPATKEGILREVLKGHAKADATFAVNFHEITHEAFLALQKTFPEAKWVDATAAIRKARGVKDAGEIERIQEAARIGSTVAREIPSMLTAGMTEIALAAQMEYRMMQLGASGRSFATIVGFGANSAEPHYAPQKVKLAPGQSIVCDFGAYYHRYACDITRSFHFGPRDDELKRVHETVYAAQQAALAVLGPGVAGQDVHAAAQKVVDASPWKGRFTHGLGHALGLAVHDAGVGLYPGAEDKLEPGMVVTVEPGIYLPGHGGVRIEDDVVITKDGYKFLTTAPREYLEVSA